MSKKKEDKKLTKDLYKKSKKTKKIKNVPKTKIAPKTKLDTISLFRNDLELVPKRREPQQRPLSPRHETNSRNSILSSRRSKNHNLVSPSRNLILSFRSSFHNEVVEDVDAVRVVLERVRDRSSKVIWCPISFLGHFWFFVLNFDFLYTLIFWFFIKFWCFVHFWFF